MGSDHIRSAAYFTICDSRCKPFDPGRGSSRPLEDFGGRLPFKKSATSLIDGPYRHQPIDRTSGEREKGAMAPENGISRPRPRPHPRSRAPPRQRRRLSRPRSGASPISPADGANSALSNSGNPPFVAGRNGSFPLSPSRSPTLPLSRYFSPSLSSSSSHPPSLSLFFSLPVFLFLPPSLSLPFSHPPSLSLFPPLSPSPSRTPSLSPFPSPSHTPSLSPFPSPSRTPCPVFFSPSLTLSAPRKMEEKRWELREDVVVEVLCQLPNKSASKFKCVCKQWLGLISDGIFRVSSPKPISHGISLFLSKAKLLSFVWVLLPMATISNW